MTNLDELRELDEISTGEALEATFKLSEKYINVLNNILRIKKQTPTGEQEGFFRSRRDNTALLESLLNILFELEKELKSIELALAEKNQ